MFLKLLDDDLPLAVVHEVVGLEEVAGEERLQVLDVDLASLIFKLK
jgi:hypothetical protein